MADPFIGEIRMFGGNFAPVGWALCNGQLLPISQNTALFSLLGTNFGGNGTSTFGLPNLQGSVPMHFGDGPGLTPRTIGETGGQATVALTQAFMPPHTHTYSGVNGNAASTTPTDNFPAVNRGINAYTTPAAAGGQIAGMSVQGVATAGGGQAHNNLQPYLVINFIIALQGVFPSRQ